MRKENNRVTGLGASVILGMWESERALHSKQRLNNIKNMRSLFSDATIELWNVSVKVAGGTGKWGGAWRMGTLVDGSQLWWWDCY